MISISFKDKYKIFYPRRYEGIYTSRGDNPLFSIRIRQGKGRDHAKWSAEQFEKLAEIVKDYGNNKIHLTSRGDVELYGIDMRNLDEILFELEKVGLSPRDSCGASVRNVIPCLSQICPKANVDAEKLAVYISNFFRYNKEYEYPNLPKRVKISISACEVGCAHPAIMDVGIIAKENGKFDVMIGGGIGEKAFEGKTLFTDIAVDKLLPICVAVANILKKENEKRGFKHVVEKYGEEKIKEMIMREAESIAPSLPPVEDHFSLPKTIQMEKIVRVKPIGGWLHVDDVPEIVSVMRENLGFGYLFNTQELYIPIQTEDFSLKIRAPYEITDTRMWEKTFNVNSCIGNDYCPPALVPTTEMATKVYERLKDEGIKVRISFSGCTHSCGKHWVMDLGFGAIANRGNVRLNVVVGGGNKNIGKVIGSIPADKYMTVVDKFIKLVKEGEINLDNIDVDKLKKNLRDIEGFEEYK
ncbi:nitrite/sulfite reductase [Sulfolobaceae archaeon RB850M]